MTVNDTDKFIVNRSGSSYKLEAQNLMADLLDTDLMLVNRGGLSYKATGAEIKASMKPPATVNKPSIVAPADGAGEMIGAVSDEITSYNPSTKTLTLAGDKDLTVFQALDDVQQDSGHTPQTSVITGVGPAFEGTVGMAWSSGLSTEPVWSNFPDVGTIDLGPNYNSDTAPNITQATGIGDNDTWGYWFSPSPTGPWSRSSSGTPGGIPQVLPSRANRYLRACLANGSTTDAGRLTFDSTTASILGATTLTLTDDTDLANFRVGDVETGGGTVLAIGPGNKLTISGGTWSNGDTVTGPTTTPATGTIAALNVAAKTMTLSVSDETSPKRWIVNQSKFVKGEETPSADAAPDPSGVNFVGSNFGSSDGSLTHASSDWQVTLKTDTGYASIVDQAAADTTIGPPPAWTSGALADETAYRARVRYNAATGEVSPWSDDITFKTAKVDKTVADPGDYYVYDDNTNLTKIPAPTLFINAGLGVGEGYNRSYLAVGADGKCYQSPDTTGPFQELTFAATVGISDAKILQGSYREKFHLVISDTNVATVYKDATVVDTVSNVEKLCPPGAVNDLAVLLTQSHEVYVSCLNSSSTPSFGTDFGSPGGAFKKIPFGSSSPDWGANTVVDVCGCFGVNYDAIGLIVLASDGYLWSAFGTAAKVAMVDMGVNGGETVQAPNTEMVRLTSYGNDWKEVSSITCYGRGSGFSALKNNGELWVAVLESNDSISGIHAFSKWGDSYSSTIVSVYQRVASYALKSNGDVWGNIGSKSTAEADWVKLATPSSNPVKSIGSLAGNLSGAGQKLPILTK